jgi:MarR family 2-MHQ and catechol resistance regulon transcriptional repressor
MGTKYQGTNEEIRALNAFIKLSRAMQSVESRLLTSVARNDLTITQFGVLETLYHLGSMPQVEIGRKLLKSGGNITLVIDNLEKRGLVQRQRGHEDRRQVFVSLTPAGREMITAALPGHIATIVATMQRLSAEEQDELARLSKKLGLGGEQSA